MTGALDMPARYTTQIVKALEQTRRPALVWLEFQDCAGNSESALRASHPSFADIVLELLSWNYHETVMAPSGKAAEKSLHDTVTMERGQEHMVTRWWYSACSRKRWNWVGSFRKRLLHAWMRWWMLPLPSCGAGGWTSPRDAQVE